jgi:hypothetical protein
MQDIADAGKKTLKKIQDGFNDVANTVKGAADKAGEIIENAKENVSNWIEGIFGKAENTVEPEIVPEEITIPAAPVVEAEHELPEQEPIVPQIPLTQELLEEAYELQRPSACALTSGAWLNNEYLKTLGRGLTTDEIIEALRPLKGTAFLSDAEVKNFTSIAKKMSAVKDEAAYLVRVEGIIYATEEAVAEAGYQYYLEVRRHVNNPETRMHFPGHANGEEYDPYSTPVVTKWWEDPRYSTVEYRVFTLYEPR